MDFELDEDQLELQRVVRDVVARECPPALARAVVEGRDDGDALWKVLGQLDWPALTIPEDDEGLGLTAVELVIALEELGGAADPTPFLATTSQYVPLLRECAPAGHPLRRERLGAVAAGGSGAAAFGAGSTVRATPHGDGWRLDGTARHVLDGDRADEIAVVATAPGADGRGGTGVFVVPRAGATSATRSTTFDATLHVAEVTFDGVPVGADRALVGPDVAAGVERATGEAVTGLAAATVGAAQRILDLAVAHVKERHQFGVPIGSFQAVKHMAVDVHVAVERARALCHFAALAAAEDDPRRPLAASMAKAAAGDAQRIAVRHGVQLFGGLGFTWENDLQLYVRRAQAGDLLLGTGAEHRRRVGRLALGGEVREARP